MLANYSVSNTYIFTQIPNGNIAKKYYSETSILCHVISTMEDKAMVSRKIHLSDSLLILGTLRFKQNKVSVVKFKNLYFIFSILKLASDKYQVSFHNDNKYRGDGRY